MGLTPGEIQALLEMFEASTWQDMTIDIGVDHLHVSRRANGSSPPAPESMAPESMAPERMAPESPAREPMAPESVAPEPAAAASDPLPAAPPAGIRTSDAGRPAGNGAVAGDPAGVVVEAPSVGLFWRSPAPGAPPFIEVGSRVGPDDTIAIIEVMKLMSPLKAGRSGVVTAILADNGATVARGEPLVLVLPDA
jgi:acetyl-CoA carboxylase biotin carboxyl carrier protein